MRQREGWTLNPICALFEENWGSRPCPNRWILIDETHWETHHRMPRSPGCISTCSSGSGKVWTKSFECAPAPRPLSVRSYGEKALFSQRLFEIPRRDRDPLMGVPARAQSWTGRGTCASHPPSASHSSATSVASCSSALQSLSMPKSYYYYRVQSSWFQQALWDPGVRWHRAECYNTQVPQRISFKNSFDKHLSRCSSARPAHATWHLHKWVVVRGGGEKINNQQGLWNWTPWPTKQNCILTTCKSSLTLFFKLLCNYHHTWFTADYKNELLLLFSKEIFPAQAVAQSIPGSEQKFLPKHTG